MLIAITSQPNGFMGVIALHHKTFLTSNSRKYIHDSLLSNKHNILPRLQSLPLMLNPHYDSRAGFESPSHRPSSVEAFLNPRMPNRILRSILLRDKMRNQGSSEEARPSLNSHRAVLRGKVFKMICLLNIAEQSLKHNEDLFVLLKYLP